MKFVTDSPFGDPDAAARKLVEIANAVETIQDILDTIRYCLRFAAIGGDTRWGDENERSSEDRRARIDRRSGTDARSDEEKQRVGERRSQLDRRSGPMSQKTSNEQLAPFARRLKRAMSNEKSREFFGVANGENDFAFYPDVLRTAEWIQSLVSAEPDQPEHPVVPAKITLRKTVS